MMNDNKRYSVGSFSLLSGSSDGQSVDASFTSMSSSGSTGYEIESDVGREALKEICCSALSRILDFPDNHLETLLGYEEENRSGDSGGSNVAKNISSSLHSMKRGLSALYHHHHTHAYHVTSCEEARPVACLSFGSPLVESDHIVILQLITHMNTFVSIEGLFRKSGNKTRMEQLAKGLQDGQLGEVVACKTYNAHDFASIFKQYFSELPEPLLLKRHLNAYLQAAGLSSPTLILHCMQLLMLLLPPTHRVVLQHLLDLLFQVTRSPSNKMDSHNLSLILAPTLFLATRSESLPPESFEKLHQLLKYMIENSEDIFEVPSEVQVVADRYCRKKSRRMKDKMLVSTVSGDMVDGGDGEKGREEEIVIDAYTTSCKRQCAENYHESGKDHAMDEVAKLYEMVKNMPEGPQKAHFLKRFESASKAGCTPSSVPKQQKQSSLSRLKRSLRKNKENATPKVTRNQIQLKQPCFTKRSLASEFDQDEDSVTVQSSRVAVNSFTPHKNKDVFKTPAPLRTGTYHLPPLPSPFPAPKTCTEPQSDQVFLTIPTDSAMVTDV